MRRRSRAGGKPAKTRPGKTVSSKRRNAPKAARERSPTIADLQDDLDRRTRERDEAREQQTATSEVLRVVSSSPGDLQSVFTIILKNAVRICEAKFGALYLNEGDGFRAMAMHNAPPAYEEARAGVVHPPPSSSLWRAATTKQAAQVADVMSEQGYVEGDPFVISAVALGGYRSVFSVPMLHEDKLIGVITIFRQEARPFTDKQIALVQYFASQAVIAIENARLLNELRQRTTDLSEALEQQTATSDVLQVISSSPGDLQPVFATMLENATRICDAKFANIYVRDSDAFRLVATHNTPPAFAESRRRGPFRPNPGHPFRTLAETKQVFHLADVTALPGYKERDPQIVEPVELGGIRTCLGVPMLKEDNLIGALIVFRQEVRPFSDKQIGLLTNFAAQAVIAMENARLLTELRQSLEQQTATAEVLGVISSSKFELQPILQSVVDTAARLCRADAAVIFRLEDGIYQFAAGYSLDPAYLEIERRTMIAPGPGTLVGRAAMSRQVVRIGDAWSDSAYEKKEQAKLGQGFRSMMGVPLMRDGEAIGVIGLARSRVEPFAEREVDLVTTFADQAVIAIENVRLFEAEQERTRELSESLEQQTATSDVLNVISRSRGELEPVFQAILVNATRMCEAQFGVLHLSEGDVFRTVALHNAPPGYVEAKQRDPVIRYLPPTSALARLKEARLPVQIADVRQEAAYNDSRANNASRVAFTHLTGVRSLLAIPMVSDETLIGAIQIYRQEVRPFTDKQIELMQNFAAQAVIAIENARLLNELHQRTDDLTKSLDELQTAQDRLVQTEKLASLGQLTAGIAHEIKNPLNFVNNFSAVSVELIDELREALGGVHLDKNLRAEINEIADTLQGNLDKIVQHGKRADAIVKNMLLHSRQGSGEYRPVDINALVDESLNLAYHGARAEQQGFNITLERSFDPTAGEVDLFPQEITRALLNVISNGFYAATKRKAESNGRDYEPTLAVATKNLGSSVEIRIRDNGTGIPPEVKDKLFNPFFTTKPAGEGTGLGLSISHDIIVKQHGGSIEVNTQPSEFTEFRIVLPRAAAFIGGGRA